MGNLRAPPIAAPGPRKRAEKAQVPLGARVKHNGWEKGVSRIGFLSQAYVYDMLSIGTHMPALYVEKIPDDLYQALRKRARENRKSIAAEVISLLERNVPTAKELQRRREFYRRMAELRARQPERQSNRCCRCRIPRCHQELCRQVPG